MIFVGRQVSTPRGREVVAASDIEGWNRVGGNVVDSGRMVVRRKITDCGGKRLGALGN